MGRSDVTPTVVGQIEVLIRGNVFSLREIARRCNTSKPTVERVRKRFQTGRRYIKGLEGVVADVQPGQSMTELY